MTAEARVAALVVMRPAGGGDVTTRAIAADNIGAAVPAREEAARARRFFSESGFQVGPLVGVSFSIEGPRELMEAWFQDFADREGTDAELSLDRLPPEVAGGVRAVATQAPPDFGPTSP